MQHLRLGEFLSEFCKPPGGHEEIFILGEKLVLCGAEFSGAPGGQASE